MHLYVMARGHIDWINRWENNLTAQMLPWNKMNPATGKKEGCHVQLAMRPVRLYEIVFPEEHLDFVMSMVAGAPSSTYGNNYPWYRRLLNWGRLILGLKKKETWEVKPTPTIPPQGLNVGVHVLGIKEDIKDANGDEML
jgi:hypothetical protein